MGILDKFLKKNQIAKDQPIDDIDTGLPGNDDLGLDNRPMPGEVSEPGSMPNPISSMPTAAPASFNEQQQFGQSSTLAKDIEIISAKLDSIRAILENINQRIEHLERIAAGEYETQKRQFY